MTEPGSARPLDYLVFAFLSLLALYGFSRYILSGGLTADSLLADIPTPDILLQQSKEFDREEVIQVVDGVYVAVGYSVSNSIMLQAPDGVIIIDTSESVDTGEKILSEFRRISDKPIKGIIYTCTHVNHVQGAAAFVEDAGNPPEIWAHHTSESILDDFFMVSSGLRQRNLRQSGGQLLHAVTSGIGPSLKYTPGIRVGMVRPNRFLYATEQDIEIAGLSMRLMHVPGESSDHIAVWLEDSRVLICGDNLYKAYPSLQDNRGTPQLNVLHWIESLDKMRVLFPEYIVPSYTKPLQGKQFISDVLRDYRDALQYIHDQTVRLANKGMTPDDITQFINLPAVFESHPFLQQVHGTLEWSVRSIYTQYFGWFSGDVVNLRSLSRRERAQRMVALVGGVSAMRTAASDALQNGHTRWALELASQVFLLDTQDTQSREIRAKAIKMMASEETCASVRNYLLTQLLEDFNFVTSNVGEPARSNAVETTSPKQILNALRTRYMAEKCGHMKSSAVFNFTDIEEIHTVYIRSHIVHFVQEDTDWWSFRVILEWKVFMDIMSRARSPVTAYISGDLHVEGGVAKLREFMDCFDLDV